jgi:hypothetical protein
MPTSPNQPVGPEEAEREPQNKGELEKFGLDDLKGSVSVAEEERLAQIFESILIKHEEVEAGPSLSPEQISLAIKYRQDEAKRSHERTLLRAKQRHEVTLNRQHDDSVQRERLYELRKARLTFLPKIALAVGALVVVGAAAIIYILVSHDAKDQVPLVLTFLSGLTGGILAGFGGGFATARLLPSGAKDKATRPAT